MTCFCLQKTIPISYKEVNIMNLPPAMYFAFEFGKSLLSDKMAKRLQVTYTKYNIVTCY